MHITARRKAVLPALGGLAIGIYILSTLHPSAGGISTYLPYLWPSQSAEEVPASPISSRPARESLPKSPAHQEPAVVPSKSAAKDEWTTFHQISAIRHSKWADTEDLPLASDGALSGKGHRASFRTNLRDDMMYLMSFPAFGLTNQFISIYVQIYMAYLTGRTPILQTFFPHFAHLHGHAPFLPISEVYDLNRLRAVLDLPIVEMWELKGSHTARTSDPTIEEPPEVDNIGCWSHWMTAYGGEHSLNSDYMFKAHSTPIPQEAVRSGILSPHLLDVVDLLQPRPEGQKFVLPPGSQSVLTRLNVTQPEIIPENHVACIDIAMFMQVQPDRWDVTGEWVNGDGAWQAVGRHMRFQPRLLDIAEQYLRRTFSVADGESIPPYIGVHIRRTDFSEDWKALTLRDYAHATSIVLENIRKFLGVPVKHILVLTDELDPEWLAQVNEYNGWYVVNHEEAETMTKLGAWYATLLDTVFMSGGIGLVGLYQSTMAITAAHRVTEWNAGVSKLIYRDYHDHVPADWEWSY